MKTGYEPVQESILLLPPKVSMLGVGINTITVSELIDVVIQRARCKGPLRVMYVNAHCLNLAWVDKEYRRLLNGADVVYPDGMAVVWASRLLGKPLPERVNAGDFLIRLCNEAAQWGLSLYFVGCRAGVAERAATVLKKASPGVQIVGARYGYFDADEEQAIVADIKAKRPGILLVGMGSPRQETWIEQHRGDLDTPVGWTVGALFEYYAGVRRRAPVWVRNIGCEWAFRLLLEPRRMWRRYLLGNALFALRVLVACLRARRGKNSEW